LTWLGQAEEGIEWIRKAMRLNPYHPERFWNHLARAYFVARRYDDALDALRHIRIPDGLQRAAMAACHARLGEAEAAEQQRQLALAAMPTLTVGECVATLHYKRAEDLAHHRQSLELAGFPP
jgi:adenylate cyclase